MLLDQLLEEFNSSLKNSYIYNMQASKVDFAGVILWDISSWNQICTLEGHTLTVTQMAFSHDGNYLLTVSRDRTWMLYRRTNEDNGKL